MERQLLTREGHQDLIKEMDNIRKVELPKNVQDIAEARAHGDLSENAEYHAAKERQSILSAKLRELEEILAIAEIVDPLPDVDEKVVFGCHVTVYNPDNDEENTYQIVGQRESNPAKGRISLDSPLGQALLGKEEGDEVRFKTPGGERILEIVTVE